ARPGWSVVSCSPKLIGVSKILAATFIDSPSVTRDGSSETESPPRPKTSVLPPPLLSPAVSPSVPPSLPLPELQAARTMETISRTASVHNFPFFTMTPPSLVFYYHRRALPPYRGGTRQNDRFPVPTVSEPSTCRL